MASNKKQAVSVQAHRLGKRRQRSCFLVNPTTVVGALSLVAAAHQFLLPIHPKFLDVFVGTVFVSKIKVDYNQRSSDKRTRPALQNEVQAYEVQAYAVAKYDSQQSTDWQIVLPNASEFPYNEFAPHLDVIWSRGWYNVEFPPLNTVPLGYYNDKGRTQEPTPLEYLYSYWDPTQLCQKGKHNYLWIRNGDEMGLAKHMESFPSHCNISIITSDNDLDTPGKSLPMVFQLLNSSKLHQWYSQNLVTKHPNMYPIPIGLPLHYGCENSPHTLDTIQMMVGVRSESLPFEKRNSRILVDVGGSGGFRDITRSDLRRKIERCGLTAMDPVPTLQAWERYSSHQFAVAPSGNGRDTFRLWELLFFGTIPIIMSGDVDLLVLPAHVPVVIVDNWKEVCVLAHNATLYNQTLTRYKDWVQNSHHWMRPGLWVPRDQAKMDNLCEQFAGCMEAANLSHRLSPRDVDAAMKKAQKGLERAIQRRYYQDLMRQLIQDMICAVFLLAFLGCLCLTLNRLSYALAFVSSL